jgi:hypothetical protein
MPKFDTESPQRIAATDYNAIRNKIVAILGTGSGQQGYGQPLASSAVFAGNNITKAQWDSLRYDLVNAKVHQDGVSPSIVTVSSGDFIGYGAGYPNNNYDSIAEQAILNRFNIGAGQSMTSLAPMAGQTTLGVISRTGSWSTQSQCTLTVTFNGGYTVTNADGSTFTATGADHARHFFNSGGRMRFTSTRTGGASTSQNNAWTNLLSTTVGTLNFGAQTPATVNFYTLTTSYQQWYTVSSSVPYASNFYRIEALCNCTDPTNVNGTASVVTFRITWADSYIDPDTLTPGYPAPVTIHPPGDTVDGTLSLTVEEFKATGPFIPSGLFTITSPSYSISAITAT